MVHYFNLEIVLVHFNLLFKYTSTPVQLRHLMWYFDWGVCRSSCINLVNLPRSANQGGFPWSYLYTVGVNEANIYRRAEYPTPDSLNPRLIRTYPSEANTVLLVILALTFAL